ncbi:site-specific integrase [Microvirga terricola]|uniref:Tyrosine-type recombinase/integrase n=1 Tax=Microvirga terricola TaxID=2719797 RepID=A0ABX0V5T5_9HYPH|nr:tyrosine-type recombinase/integrase [Microvirga terricola]NIX75205.1 tyrosine-type recombinase/integrase [Microvirga terricola]
MATVKLDYVTTDVDGNGNVRYYFRRAGQRKIRLRGNPLSEEFQTAYRAALAGDLKPTNEKLMTPPKGSFRALCVAYYGSPKFKRLDEKTKEWQRRHLDAVAAKHGDKPTALLQPRHIRSWRDKRASTPAAANTMLKALSGLFSWGMEYELCDHNPVTSVKKMSYSSRGFHTWTVEEVKKFEETHPIGTTARLALILLKYTAGRREDAVRLGPQNIKDGRIRFTQAKNEHRKPVAIDLPVHPDLAHAIASTPVIGHSTFLVTTFGKPFTAAGFGNKFRDWCDQAGLPHCSAHGMRKAVATRLAEAGASTHQIQAVTGHQSLGMLAPYTRDANKSTLADSAMKLLEGKS